MSQRTSRALYDVMEKHRNPIVLEENIVGSQYFNETFTYGKIILNNRELKKVYALRYNAYLDEIEINDGVKTDAILKEHDISCLIDGKKYSYLAHFKKNSDDAQLGYLKTIFEGDKITLYLKETKIFKEGQKAKTSLTTSIPPKLVGFKVYYFSKKGETPYGIKLKNKELLTIILPEYRPQMKAYIKSNHLKFKRATDLIKFFEYYDSLVLNKIWNNHKPWKLSTYFYYWLGFHLL